VSVARKRTLGNVLIFGVSLPAVLVILVLGVGAMWQPRLTLWIIPVMLSGLLAAHVARMLKAPVPDLS
jgi:hypothetical protein